jgi:hypothetical protein
MEAIAMTDTPIHQVTLRLPEPLYLQVKQLARRRQISINRLAQEGLESIAQQSLVREMRAAYDALALETEESDVEVFFAAQSEVVADDPA